MKHAYCYELLRDARRQARAAGVTVPAGLCAMRSTARLYFVQASGGDCGRYVKADCSYSARATYILTLIAIETRAESTAPEPRER